MKIQDLYRWGYQTPNSWLSYLTNVIQCQCGNKAAKMRGLYKLVTAGHEVRPAQFDMFRIVVDGRTFGIEILESPKLVETWADFAPVT